MSSARGGRMQRQRDHGDQRTRDDERTRPLHQSSRSGAARSQCDGEGGDQMIRREFITLLGSAAAWPLAARAQQADRTRRIAVFMDLAEGDPEGQARVAALKRGLQDLGWIEGRNLRIESRWAAGEAARMRPLGEELVSLAPEVIVSSGAPTLAALQQTTRTIPLVFGQVLNPV